MHGVDCNPSSHGPFSCDDVCGNSSALALGNDFIQVVIDVAHPSIQLFGDASGQQNFTTPSMATPIALQQWSGGKFVWKPAPGKLHVLSNTTDNVTVSIEGIVDNTDDVMATETWVLTVLSASRSVTWTAMGSSNVSKPEVTVFHTLGMTSSSIYAFFKDGVVQMRDYTFGTFVASDHADRIYALGGGSSLVSRTLSLISL